MFNVKGFMAIGALADNAVGVVAPLGELSTNSLTYAKEKGYYTNTETKDVALVTFTSVNDGGEAATVPADLALTVLRVGQWCYGQSMAGSITGDSESFVRNLAAEFTATVSDAESGSMVTDGKYWLPEWVSFKALTTNAGDTPGEIKIWFADDAFQRQFADYEIVVVPPIPVAKFDDLFDADKAATLLARRKQSEIMFEIQTARGKYPETYLRTEEYTWVDPDDENNTIEHGWTVLIYGVGGNNIDTIKERLTSYILANSTHTRAEWAEILPDLFKSTEFILTPLWDQYSIPNQTLMAGVHSSTVNPNRVIEVGLQTAIGYPEAHVKQYVNSFAFMYKSLAIVAIGGPDNRDKIYEFRKKFADYINVPGTHADFNRMSPTTMAFIQLLAKMLLIAEEMTAFTDIPVGFTRLERDNVMYVAANFNEVQYLVVAKAFFNAPAKA